MPALYLDCRLMRRTLVAVAVAGLVVGCGPRADRPSRGGTPLEQGRTYTTWLYERRYQQLWDRFSPEMRQTFKNAGDLAGFAGTAIEQLGTEQGTPTEQVTDDASVRVYTRTAAFDRAPGPVVIQWSLAEDGQVTGFVVRPVTEPDP